MTSTAPARGALPIVDVGGLRSTDPDVRDAAVAALHRACTEAGFCYAVGHGVSDALCAGIEAQARRFFALPVEQKLRVDVARSPAFRGYAPLARQTLDAGTPPDVKESFAIGSEIAPDHPLARTFGYGPNQWPSGLPGFRTMLDAYARAMLDVAATLMTGLARSLRLSEDAFAHFCAPPIIAGLRLLRYPPHPADAPPEATGCGAHTDWGAVTILLQDDVGGLEIWSEERGWIEVPPVRGAFVINIGDMMARWTNDAYRSTRHRVINRTERGRFSAAFFYDGRGDCDIRCLPGCLRPGERPKYAPTTPAEHLAEMKRRSYGR